MDFDLSEEQTMLRDSLERMLAERYSFEERRRYLAAPEGFSADMWSRYAEMGLMALPFAEADGGLGGGPVETMIVMEALGGALALEPYFSTIVLAGGLLRHGADAKQRAALVPALAEGSLRMAFAHTERHSRYDLRHVETTARRDGEGFVLDGAKSVVLDGDGAARLLVTARLAGNARDQRGIGVFLVDGDAAGVTRRGYALQDGRRAAEIGLEKVRVGGGDVLGDPEDGFALVGRVVDEAIAALGAEAVGVMGAMHRLTVDYLKVRKQFGVPISQFQVLQHQAVDMFVACEQSRSMALFGTMMAASGDDAERRRAMHAVKAEIGRNGMFCGETAIQLHGGVGMTMEYAIGHYFKRMTMIDILFGDHDHHLRALAADGGLMAA